MCIKHFSAQPPHTPPRPTHTHTHSTHFRLTNTNREKTQLRRLRLQTRTTVNVGKETDGRHVRRKQQERTHKAQGAHLGDNMERWQNRGKREEDEEEDTALDVCGVCVCVCVLTRPGTRDVVWVSSVGVCLRGSSGESPDTAAVCPRC